LGIYKEFMENNYCGQILNRELSERKAKNSYYSLRAFARDLGIGSTSLSDVLANKRSLSKTNIEKVSDKLGLSPIDIDLMLGETKGRTAREDLEEKQRLQLEEDTFRLIADWYHLAILSLAKIPGSLADPCWLSERLGITVSEAELALNTLKRLGFIEIKRGKIYRTTVSLSTTRDIPSSAIRKYHRSNLRLAEDSLEQVNVELREFSSMTMAIDPDKLPQAKDILMRTKRRISKLLESGKAKEVYTLTFQLFPVTTAVKEGNH
jgi:hypothetical protein